MASKGTSDWVQDKPGWFYRTGWFGLGWFSIVKGTSYWTETSWTETSKS